MELNIIGEIGMDDDEGGDSKRINISFSNIFQSIWIQRVICRHNALHSFLLENIINLLRYIGKSIHCLFIT